MKCNGLKKDGSQCSSNAADESGFCHMHKQNDENQEVKETPLEDEQIPEVFVMDSQLEVETRERHDGNPMTVHNGDPRFAYKNVGNDPVNRSNAIAEGWRFLKVSKDGENRPRTGQSPDVPESFREQVNEKGEIQCGDTVLAYMPKEKREAILKAEQDEWDKRIGDLLNDKDDPGHIKQLNRSLSGKASYEHHIKPENRFFRTDSEGRIIRNDSARERMINPIPNNRKSFLITNNPLAK